MNQASLRVLPSVGGLLEHPRIAPLVRGRRRDWMTRVIQEVIAAQRKRLQETSSPDLTRESLLEACVNQVIAVKDVLLGPSLRRVINATGVIVHTNLGRSLHPDLAVDWAQRAARRANDLEYDLETGRRGHRGRKVERKVAFLTGAEDALIVNNNAAAVWLAVRTCATEGRVILSRGEAVAIGGSFRMHEILQETGCELVEIGTTNRTTLQDYRDALIPGAVVVKVHRSNFYQVGFTEDVTLGDLATLSRECGCKLIYDAGSGALFPFNELGLPHERTLAEDLALGPDLVTCSGDKLLGGSQAGIALGQRELVADMRRHTMRRAFRVDKTTLAAVDAVLTIYLRAEDMPALPTLETIACPIVDLTRRAEHLLNSLGEERPAGWRGAVVAATSSIGGGSFSEASVTTKLALWTGPKAELEKCHAALRRGDPSVVTRMNQDGLAVDLRTVAEDELELVIQAFRNAWRSLAGGSEG